MILAAVCVLRFCQIHSFAVEQANWQNRSIIDILVAEITCGSLQTLD